MSRFVKNKDCPKCSITGAGKSLAVYEDGSEYCFECGYVTQPEGDIDNMSTKKNKPLIDIGEYRAIPSRGITLETAKKFKCTVTEYKGATVMCMSYYDKGVLTAQKLKFKSTSEYPGYMWLGDPSKVPPLWGMNLFQPNPKLSVTICEGETDMLCRSSLNQDKWPVLSLVDGAGGQAYKNISKAKEYLLGFKKIVVMFDGDETGRKCAHKVSEILGPKCFIANIPDGEDVCSLAVKGEEASISYLEMTAVNNRPKDIITASDYTDEDLYSIEKQGLPLPYPKLNKLLRGIKLPRLYMVCAGTGIGKSAFIKEIAYDLMFNQGVKVGCIFLEQGDKESIKDFIAMDNQIESEDFCMNPDVISIKDRNKSLDTIKKYGVFYKHFGSLDIDTLIAKIEYMMIGCDCDFIMLDHISMVVSGSSSSVEGERRDIDRLMTKLKTLVQSTGKSIIAVSHLKRPHPSRTGFNVGGEVLVSDLRGSAAIEQISDYIIALERDQFDEEAPDTCNLKVLKCRRGGTIGYADTLKYSHETGRLTLGETQ